MSHKVTVPEDIELLDPLTEKPTGQKLSFWHYLNQVVLVDRSWGNGYESLVQRGDIRDQFKDQEPGAVVGLPASLHSPLVEVIKSPANKCKVCGTSELNVAVVGQLLPFMSAVCEAEKTD